MKLRPYKVIATYKSNQMIKVEISTIMAINDINAIVKAKSILQSVKSDIDLTQFNYYAKQIR